MKLEFDDYVTGATAATRLTNSSADVRREGGEQLTSAAALGRLLSDSAIGLPGRRTPEDLAQVLVLREEVRALLATPDEDDMVAGANRLLGRAGATAVLERDPDGRWLWYLKPEPGSSPADVLAFVIGAGLLGVVRTLGHDRLRSCDAPDCTGMFVDTSRAGRRRFCTPELCGNRLNVANHRARRRESGPP